MTASDVIKVPAIYCYTCPDGRRYVGGAANHHNRNKYGLGRSNPWINEASVTYSPETWTYEVLEELPPDARGKRYVTPNSVTLNVSSPGCRNTASTSSRRYGRGTTALGYISDAIDETNNKLESIADSITANFDGIVEATRSDHPLQGGPLSRLQMHSTPLPRRSTS